MIAMTRQLHGTSISSTDYESLHATVDALNEDIHQIQNDVNLSTGKMQKDILDSANNIRKVLKIKNVSFVKGNSAIIR